MEGSILAMRLVAPDNRSHMCCSADEVFDQRVKTCPICGFRTDYRFVSDSVELTDSSNDISYTYDGYCVVSDRCRELLSGVPVKPEFLPLTSAPGFSVVFPQAVADIDRSLLRFEDRCTSCGEFRSVIGQVALSKDINHPLQRGVYRSDVMLGSQNEKGFIEIVSIDVAEELSNAGLSGLSFYELRLLSTDERDRLAHQVHNHRFEENLRRVSKPWWKLW